MKTFFKKVFLKSSFISFLSAGILSAHASDKSSSFDSFAPLPTILAMTETDANALFLKYQVKKNRTISSVGDLLSGEAQAIRDSLIAAKTGLRLDELISQYDANYSSLKETDSQWIVLNLSLLKCARSFFYRIRPFVENEKKLVTHSLLLAGIRGWVAGMSTFFPADQWLSAFQYISEPLDANAKKLEINNEVELQKMLQNEWPSVLQTAIDRAKALQFSKTTYLDLKILSGESSFPKKLGRFYIVDQLDRNLLLSGLNFSLAGIYTLLAYEWTDMLGVAQEMAKYHGFQSLKVFGGVDGPSSKDHVEKIQSFGNFLRLKEKSGALILKDFAFVAYRNGLLIASKTWGQPDAMNTMAARISTNNGNVESGEKFLLNPLFFAPHSKYWVELAGLAREAYDKGSMTLYSQLNKKAVMVNVNAFFLAPPADLKAFLPTQFYGFNDPDKTHLTSSEIKKVFTDKDTKKEVELSFRNYHLGRPIGWNSKVYSQYFALPNNTPVTDQNVKDVLATLSQSVGGISSFLPGFAVFGF